MAAPRARPAQTRNGGHGRRNRLKVTSCRAHLLPSPIAATPIPVPPLPLHRTTSHARYPTPLPDTCPPLNPQPSTPTQNPKSIPIARQWTNGRAAAAAVLDTTKARRGYCEVTAAKGDCSRAAPGGKSRYSPSAHAPVRIWSEARLCWRAPAAQWRGRAMLRPPHAHVHAHAHVHVTCTCHAHAHVHAHVLSLCLCTYYRYVLTIAAVLDLIAEQTEAHGGPVVLKVVVGVCE